MPAKHAAEPPTPISDRFLAVLRTRPARHQVEDTEYVAMLWRMVRALEARTIENPEMLPQAVALAQRLAELVNVAIYSNAERYRIDPRRGASMAECARVMGITKQSASERMARGKAVILARLAAAGAIRFSEARREREAIQAAAEHAAVSLDGYRGRHRRAA